MKKFSDKINENNSLKNYNYKMQIDVEGNIVAESEGDAGEMVDKLVDEIGAANESINVTNYMINVIDEIGPRELYSDIEESNINENLSNEAFDRMDGLHSIEKMNDALNALNDVSQELWHEGFDAEDIKLFIISKIEDKLHNNE